MKTLLTSALVFLTLFIFALDNGTSPIQGPDNHFCINGVTRLIITGSKCEGSSDFVINEIVMSHVNEYDRTVGYYGYDQVFSTEQLTASLKWLLEFKEVDSEQLNTFTKWVSNECVRNWSHGNADCIILL